MRKNNLFIAVGLLSLLLLIQSDYLFAYDEPDSFAGLKFNEDVTKQMAECPLDAFMQKYGRGQKLYVPAKSGERCYGEIEEGKLSDKEKMYVLFNMGEIQGGDKILARQLDGRLERIDLIFDTSRTTDLLAILNQRYGKPTEQEQGTVTSGAGVKLTSRYVLWKGKNVTIFFSERASRVDQGALTYKTVTWDAYQIGLKANEIKKAASGL